MNSLRKWHRFSVVEPQPQSLAMSIVLAFTLLLLQSSIIVKSIAQQKGDYNNNNNNNYNEYKIMSSSANNIGQESAKRSGPPVIGILTELFRDYKQFVANRSIFIASSYVKWLESAGAQVVPVMTNQNDSYYEQMVAHTNGLFFPGGDNLLDPHKDTPMMVAAKKLFQFAKDINKRGDYYPIWGTCLGFELLSVLPMNRNELDNCEGTDILLPVETIERGKLFAPDINFAPLPMDYSGWVYKDLLSKPDATYHNHHVCLTDDGLARAGLTDFYRPLGYSTDLNGLRFISIIEAYDYPIWATIFHPEKAAFEFVVKSNQVSMSHTPVALTASRYFADFFVSQARKSAHQWPAEPTALGSLIYAHDASYLAPQGDMYEQRYLWPFNNNGLDDEEFIDHILAEGERVPEEVSRPPPRMKPELIEYQTR